MLIYKATIIPTDMSYVGLTTHSLKLRIKQHFVDRKKQKWKNSYFHNVIMKYGKQNVVWQILEDDITDYKFLCQRQKFNILKYDTYKSKDKGYKGGYNLTLGGEGVYGLKHSDKTKEKLRQNMLLLDMSGQRHPFYGKHHSKQTIQKMCETQSKRPPYSQQYKKNMSIATSGINNCNYGRHLSERTKEKIRNALLGRTFPHMKKPMTEQAKLKLSVSCMFRPGYWKGKHLSEETKRKISYTKLKNKGKV